MGISEVTFESGGVRCAASHFVGAGAACVVMAGGLGVPRGPGTARVAEAFQRAGFHALTFDYRGFGGSGGTPRSVARVRGQLEDWDAAIDRARKLPGVDPTLISAWGFSLGGGHVLRVAATRRDLAAAVAVSPLADGRAATRNALRHQTATAMAKLLALAAFDQITAPVRREAALIPLAGPKGTVAALTTPDAGGGDVAFPGDWPRVVAARSTLGLGSYRPGRRSRRITCPLLVVVANGDQSALAAPAVEAAGRAARSEVVHLEGGHYAPFLDAFDAAIALQVQFLARHLAGTPSATHA